jgi:PAS domain S-box-containing protein
LAPPRVELPESWLGYVLLALYGVLLVYLVYRQRRDFRGASWRHWLWLIVLSAASLLTSQLFAVSLFSEDQLPPLAKAINPASTLLIFGAVPYLLAGIVLNPGMALIVGFFSGLGRAMWQSHTLLEPFQFTLAAWLAAVWLQQNYEGRIYQSFRQPIVSAAASNLLTVPLVAIGAFAYSGPGAGYIAALDLALSTASASILALLAEGVLDGLIVTVLIVGLQLRPYAAMGRFFPIILPPRQHGYSPSPQSLSFNRRLRDSFLIFSVVMLTVLIVVGVWVSLRLSTQMVVNQMVKDARDVSVRIPDFREERHHLLNEYGAMLGREEERNQQVLRQLFRSGDHFRRVVLIDQSGDVASFYPDDTPAVELTDLEQIAISDTLQTSEPFISSVQRIEGDEEVISFVVPVLDGDGAPEAALIGRVPDVSLNEMIVGLQGTVGEGQGFIVDEQNQVIAHPDLDSLLTTWNPPDRSERLIDAGNAPGTAYEGRAGDTNVRELVYYQTGPDHPWTVVIAVPYSVVLSLALQIGASLLLIGAVAMGLLGLYLLFVARSVTGPLNELMLASQSIAGGSLNTPIRTLGEDELGRLGQAFGQMQRALKKRLDELSLLLSVSQDVSASMDINQGMPAILQGTLRGTGAAGVRVVVLNPSGRQPLAFGEGPAFKSMAPFDRQVMGLLRQSRELLFTAADEVRAAFKVPQDRDLPFKAVIALPLFTHERFQGIFWLAHRQAHDFSQTELNLVRTLASQAAVLVENARLFATAEGGRRRLAAVLASTTDAVIVTDQTERILLINPAMERAFGLNAAEVRGLPVTDVVRSERLIEALTSDAERARNVEVPAAGGKTLYASVSTIVSYDGQVMGRVAVLHDITYLKELDEMKSDFVATVSHDLRSPLTFMRGYATMLPMVGEMSEKQLEYVTKILGGIEQMSALVEDLLDLGRIEAGVQLSMVQFRVDELLTSIAGELVQPARAKGVQLEVKLNPGLPLVRGDLSLIRQAVTNLVDNAIKYAPNSGLVTLSARLDRASNGLKPEMVIYVQDNGPGIAKQDQLRLFEKFYRIKQRSGPATKGSGLGLAIVKSIAERHGGRAWCHSQPGEGSTFYLSLPVNGITKQ